MRVLDALTVTSALTPVGIVRSNGLENLSYNRHHRQLLLRRYAIPSKTLKYYSMTS